MNVNSLNAKTVGPTLYEYKKDNKRLQMCDYCYDEYMEAEDYYDPSNMSGPYGSTEQQSSSLDPL